VPSALRRHGVSIVIALIAVALGVYLYAVDSSRMTTKELEARKRNLFRAWRRTEISEIAIEQKGESVRIVRRLDDAGDTMYELAGGEPADPIAVDKLLGVLEFATPERRVEANVDRVAMGLAETNGGNAGNNGTDASHASAPRARLTLKMGPMVYKLAIGGPAPAPAGAAYAEMQGVQIEGTGLFVVARDLVTELTRPSEVYRGRTLVPYLSSSLAELALEGAGGARRFVTGAWGGWAIEQDGAKVRTDRDVFDRMLTALAEVRAESFPTDEEAERALAAAAERVRIVMTPKDKALPRAVIDVGGECPGHPDDVIAVHREPAPGKSACVPKGVMNGLAAAADRFVDRRLFSLRPDEMEEVLLVAGGDRLEIVRAGTGFHQRAPTEGPVENDVGQAFMRSLHDLVAEAVTPSKEGAGSSNAPSPLPGDRKAQRFATITKADGGEERYGAETIELGEPRADGFVYARRVADGAELRLTRDTADMLRPSGLALRSRKVIDETASHVRRLVVESAAVHETLTRSPSGGYTLEEPKSFAVDAGLASDVTEALVKLRAERWVADHDDGSYGLASPSARYEVTLESGGFQVLTGRTASGGVFAKVEGRPEVFVLADATRRAIETWAIDRSYFMVDAGELKHVLLKRGATTWDLNGEARGGRDAGAALERFEVVRKALAEARTEGVVHLGAARKEEGFEGPLLSMTIQFAPPPPAVAKEIRVVVGRGDVWRDNNVFYMRRADIDATFVMAQSKLRPLLDLR
jgi:hypothetical protein